MAQNRGTQTDIFGGEEQRLSSGRREYRDIRANPYDKQEQADQMQPIIRYLRTRFKTVLRMSYNDISHKTGHSYGRVQNLLTQGTGSPTFFDIALLADAAGTSLDYLGELSGLFHPERVTDPARRITVSDEEAYFIERLRQVEDQTLRRTVFQTALDAIEYAEPPTPPKSESKKERTPRSSTHSRPRAE